MTNEIQWADGAVCYAYGKQWFVRDNEDNDLISKEGNGFANSSNVVMRKDFQLNHIRTGDYIQASELDTEQKYNDVVEVFGLFGFDVTADYLWFIGESDGYDTFFIDDDGDLDSCVSTYSKLNRRLTYSQIIAIGKLKRMMLEREESQSGGKVDASYIIGSIGPELHWKLGQKHDQVNNPPHYQFFDGVEAIEIIAGSMTAEQFKGYCMGNKLKYRLRAGSKDNLEQDIAKSNKYDELYAKHKHLCK